MQVIVEISAEDEKVLSNDLLNIDLWVQNAVLGKINSCKKRMAKEAQQVLIKDPDVTSMPATDSGLILEFMKRPGYKDRETRDAEEARKAEDEQKRKELL